MATATLQRQQISSLRERFPALQRRFRGEEVVYFDGPAGTQVPREVIDAISDYLVRCNANHEGLFATSRESDRLLQEAHEAVADLLGADDPGTVAFGQNMTSLVFALSRSLARTWEAGDRIIVTRLDHDANVTPWVLAARHTGVDVQYVGLQPDCTLDLADFESKLNDRTRLVAVGCASNATGGINPVQWIADRAHRAGALVAVDAVHYAPHRRMDVVDLDCDFLLCSAYKFFGPHVGIQWGRRPLLEELEAYKLRPASDTLPGKWMTGTQSHEGIAGVRAAVDYLAEVGRIASGESSLTRVGALDAAFQAIEEQERALAEQFVRGLDSLGEYRVWGIGEPSRFDERVSTFSITHPRHTPAAMARKLDEAGIYAWHGNYYALQLTETLGLEPEGMLRIGLLHYNTAEEVDRLLDVLGRLNA